MVRFNRGGERAWPGQAQIDFFSVLDGPLGPQAHGVTHFVVLEVLVHLFSNDLAGKRLDLLERHDVGFAFNNA